MSYHYTDASREGDPHALPDVEVFQGRPMECRKCTSGGFLPDGAQASDAGCDSCIGGTMRVTDTLLHWGYVFASPGCMWDSDPSGPYPTEAAALAAARESAGYCAHGIGDDGMCEECPAPELWALGDGERFAKATGSGWTTDTREAMAWGSAAAADASCERMEFTRSRHAVPVRLTDAEARAWGRSDDWEDTEQ